MNLFIVSNSSNVGKISEKNMKMKALERENYFHQYFEPYFSSIKAVSENKNFQDFLLNNTTTEYAENYFYSIQKSLPELRQVRYLDLNGNEIIRVNGDITGKNYSKKQISVVPKDKLQNKKHRDYFEKFIKLKKGEIGISNFDLNIEFRKIELPRQPMVRLGIIVYDSNNIKKGLLIYNISLKKLFKSLNNTVLYHLHLIDNNGTFLNHHMSEYGLTGRNNKYNLYNEFSEHAPLILEKDNYFFDGFYSHKIRNFNNGQDMKMIFELKFIKEVYNTEKTQNTFIWISIFLSIILFPIAIYFAKLPDFLKDKADEEKLKNKLSGLPNRLALVNDLINKKYAKSTVIILISINNLLKIQSTYGYKISDKVVKNFAKMLTDYNKNSISKVYSNNYYTFTINYDYKDYGTFKEFIRNLATDIENCSFTLNNEEFDFLLDITLGISNPHKLNYGIEELNEAENALDLAYSKKQSYNIFDASHTENIKSNKDNIQLARKIKNSIENDNVILHYQPIYNNFRKKIEKYECLVRIKSDNKLLFPDKFLPISKEINKYNTLSFIIIDKAFEYFSDKSYEFSINLSILDISNSLLQKHLFEKIEEYNIKDRLVIEIVEQEGVDNFNEFLIFLKRIKKYGCKVAIDDFGSGYSNFGYIIKMSEYIDYLKIDGSLIRGISKNPKTQLLVGTLKFLCDNLGIRVIAEFIEDKETFEYVDSMGISYSQGYYIGKPQDSIL